MLHGADGTSASSKGIAMAPSTRHVLVPHLITLSCCLALGWIVVSELKARFASQAAVAYPAYAAPVASPKDRQAIRLQPRMDRERPEVQHDNEQPRMDPQRDRMEFDTPFGRIRFHFQW
jgi:hypothetical protein